MQYDFVGLSAGVLGPVLMFNLQLVLYQRSGEFVMPPISGPRGSVMGCVLLAAAGYLQAYWGRRNWHVSAILTLVNVVSAIGVAQNMGFYVMRIIEHERERRRKGVEKTGLFYGILKLTGPFFAICMSFAYVFYCQYTPTAHSFFWGADGVRVQYNSMHIPGQWFTPLTFVCMATGISFFLNGGMVVNAVLHKVDRGKYKPHSNSHPSLIFYAVSVVGLHTLQSTVPAASEKGATGLNNLCLVATSTFILVLVSHTVYNFVSILDDLSAFNKKTVVVEKGPPAFKLD